MTIYTVVGSGTIGEWVSKSFYDRQAAINHALQCKRAARYCHSAMDFIQLGVDPSITRDNYHRHPITRSGGRNLHYEVFENELVIDDFMKQVMVPDLC